MILRQYAAQNAASAWGIFLWHTPEQTAMFVEVLKAHGYKECQQVFWHKTDHAAQVPVAQFTSAVEMGTLAFFPNRSANTVSLSRNPSERHNHIEVPQLTKRWKDSLGNVANPCQKPSELAAWILGSVCMPGTTVVVVGPGAGGGEVMGAVLKGINVVAIEKDKYQFEQLQAHMLHVKEQIRKADKVAIEVEDSDDDKEDESQSYSAGPQYNETSATTTAPAKPVKCRSCGGVIVDEAFTCGREDCTREEYLFHKQCVMYKDDVCICVDCSREEDERASEAETQDPT